VRILVADAFPTTHVDALVAGGHECVLRPELDATSLPTAVRGFDALVVRSTKVTADTIDAADRLALVIRAGAGVNTIDWQAAADRGIYVCNTPGKNAVAVAELTIGLITALDRRIPDAVADLREGRWRKKEYAAAQGLAGRSLGIIGFGDIGRAVAARACALEMEVIVEDKPGRSADVVGAIADLGVRLVQDLQTLLGSADVVSIHVPATEATRHMVDEEFLSHLRPGTFLINTSRGDVVDEAALLAAIEEKDLRVGLDVFAGEPTAGTAEFDSALAKHPNVYGTHHIGASTEQAQRAIADAVLEIVENFAKGIISDCVNVRERADGTATLSVRHRNRVGVLAGVLAVLRTADLNVEQMQKRVFSGGAAATATMQVAGGVTAEVVDRIAEELDVIGVSVAET
jgi:D-3-phosphoglycerate dehydrogenase